MRQARRSRQTDKMRDYPLSVIVKENVVHKIAGLLPISPEALSTAPKRTYCVCGLKSSPQRKRNTNIQCTLCKDCYHKKHIPECYANEESFVCGFCSDKVTDDNGQQVWTFTLNGEARRHTRYDPETVKEGRIPLQCSRRWKDVVEEVSKNAGECRNFTTDDKAVAKKVLKYYVDNNLGHHIIDTLNGRGGTSVAKLDLRMIGELLSLYRKMSPEERKKVR